MGFVFTGVLVGALSVQALHAQQGTTRVELQKADLTGISGTEVVMATLEIQPGGVVPRHTHPGDEFLYVLEGGSLQAPGQDPVTFKTGMSIRFPRDVPHGGLTLVSDKPLKVLTVHIVDKGKPRVELVK
ncbi:MAG: cupin domain-containing protein [Alphaproteobacteria bacterium]|nr:cupin domain-containing protein [Alphaproteobacteria bacterium]